MAICLFSMNRLNVLYCSNAGEGCGKVEIGCGEVGSGCGKVQDERGKVGNG